MKIFKVILVFFIFYFFKRFLQLIKTVNELKNQQDLKSKKFEDISSKNSDVIDVDFKVLNK